jgi:hypothetical protein
LTPSCRRKNSSRRHRVVFVLRMPSCRRERSLCRPTWRYRGAVLHTCHGAPTPRMGGLPPSVS